MTPWVRIVLTVVLGIASAAIFVLGFPRLDEVFVPTGNTLSQVSSGFFAADWSHLDETYIATHVLLDLVFIVVYASFFVLANGYFRVRRPRLASAALDFLVLAVVLDVTEDVLYLMQVSFPLLAWSKFGAFGVTLVLTTIGLVCLLCLWLKDRRAAQPFGTQSTSEPVR